MTARNIRSFARWLALSAAFSQGCATNSKSEQIKDGIPDLPAYEGPRAKITVREIKWKVGSDKGGGSLTVQDSEGKSRTVTWEVQTKGYASGLEDMLTNSLLASNRFKVLERQMLDSTRKEIGLNEEGLLKKGQGRAKGNVEGAEIEVTGAVTGWEPEIKGMSFGAVVGRFFKRFLGFGLGGVESSTSRCTLEIRAFDLNTSENLASATVVGEATSSGWSFGNIGITRNFGLGGGLSQYEKTPMEGAIRKAIAKSVEAIVKQLPKKYYRYKVDADAEPDPEIAGEVAKAKPATASEKDAKAEPAKGEAQQ